MPVKEASELTPVETGHVKKAWMAQFRSTACSDAAVQLREQVLQRMSQVEQRKRALKMKDVEARARGMDALLAELLHAQRNKQADGYFYRSSDRKSFNSKTGSAIGSKNFTAFLKMLSEVGLVLIVPGFRRSEDRMDDLTQQNVASRYKATPELLAMAEALGIDVKRLGRHYKMPEDVGATVIVRSGKDDRNEPMQFAPDDPQLLACIEQIQRINEGLARHNTDLGDPLRLKRVFNNGKAAGFAFNKGGRLYGSYQSLPKADRMAMKLDGQPVVEIDIKSCQPTILSALSGCSLPDGDLYEVADMPRELVKGLVTAMIGQGRVVLTKWPVTVAEAWLAGDLTGAPEERSALNKRFPLGQSCKLIADAIPALTHLEKGKCDWADLQFLESEVIIKTVLMLLDEWDIPALPVHDSVIVRVEDIGHAKTALIAAFREVVGIEPRLDCGDSEGVAYS